MDLFPSISLACKKNIHVAVAYFFRSISEEEHKKSYKIGHKVERQTKNVRNKLVSHT
jgi:hypothetical protein